MRNVFFVLGQEFDLFSPEHIFILGLSSEIGEFQANTTAYKSILNRIERAKNGWNSSGRPPFGRTFDKENGWQIVKKEKERIENVVREFLSPNSKGLDYISQKYGFTQRTHLRKILTEKCGNSFEQHFRSKKFDIDEIVPTKIPALLDDKTIELLKEKVKLNNTLYRRPTKHKYLFSHVLFCGHCGTALHGKTNDKNSPRYLHHKINRFDTCGFISIKASLLDQIFDHIFDILSKPKQIHNAVENAMPDLQEQKSLEIQKTNLEAKLKKAEKYSSKLIDLYLEDDFDKDTLKLKTLKNKELINNLKGDLESTKRQLSSMPSSNEINRRAKLLLRIHDSFMKSKHRLEEMTFEEKRKMIQTIFHGKDTNGKRLGVYLWKDNKNKKAPWLYEIHGILVDEVGRITTPPASKNSQNIKGNKKETCPRFFPLPSCQSLSTTP